MNYYISDLHLSHANIIKFDSRPYNTTEEMDADLISRWNKQVSICTWRFSVESRVR